MLDKQSFTKLTFFRGRVALYAILKAMGIGKDDQVAIQAFTCLAVPEAVMANGARPVYIDIEASSFNMDPVDLAKKITPKTKAVVIQHTFGIPVNMDAIISLATKLNIPIIEDCCHALLCSYNGRRLGTFGVASFYSFEWGKPLVAGLGGSATVNNPELLLKIETDYKNYGMPGLMTKLKIQLQYLAFSIFYKPSAYWFVKDTFHKLSSLGLLKSNYNPISDNNMSEDFSYKMPNFLKRRLIRKIKNIEKHAEHSRYVASEYKRRIKSRALSHPKEMPGSEIIYVRYPLLTRNKEQLLRDARLANIEISDWYYTPVHPLKQEEWHLVGYRAGSCPNAESVSRQVVTLPTNEKVAKKDIDRIIEFLNTAKI